MTAVGIGKVVIFDGQATPGAWGKVFRVLTPRPRFPGQVEACPSVACLNRMRRGGDLCQGCAAARVRDEGAAA